MTFALQFISIWSYICSKNLFRCLSILFRFWRIFQKIFSFGKCFNYFRFLFNRALLKFLAFEYFLEIFQSRHLPTLKIGKKFSRFSAWSGLHEMAVILIHHFWNFSESSWSNRRWNFLFYFWSSLCMQVRITSRSQFWIPYPFLG